MFPMVFCLAALAGGCSHYFGDGPQLTSPAAVAPASQVADIEPPIQSRVQSRDLNVRPAAGSLTLSFSYTSRILVPRGSDLKVDLHDEAGNSIGAVTRKTRTDAPPYSVVMKIPANAKFPLKVDASLTSPIGHRFTSSTEVNSDVLQQSGPVQITMDPQ